MSECQVKRLFNANVANLAHFTNISALFAAFAAFEKFAFRVVAST